MLPQIVQPRYFRDFQKKNAGPHKRQITIRIFEIKILF